MSHWLNQPLVVLDLETTDLNWDRGGIVELAFVALDNGVVSAEGSWLLNPGVPISAGATAIHGLTNKDVEGAPKFADILDGFDLLMQGRIPVAYNAPFDRNFLLASVRRVGRVVSAPALQYGTDWIDVLVWARELLSSLPNRKLGTVAAHLGIPTGGAHRALADAKQTAEVLIRLAASVPAGYGEMLTAQQTAEARQVAAYGRLD